MPDHTADYVAHPDESPAAVRDFVSDLGDNSGPSAGQSIVEQITRLTRKFGLNGVWTICELLKPSFQHWSHPSTTSLACSQRVQFDPRK